MLKGSFVALVTPFNNDGSVNFDKLRELIEYHINNNTAGLVILGTTGEATTISLEEQIEVVKFSVEVTNKRIPLMFGSGSNDTKKACELSRIYSSMGADYLLVVTPYYNRTTTSFCNHFKMLN